MKKQIVSLLLAAVLTTAAVPVRAATPTFSDVPASYWAATQIEAAASKGWVNGVGGGKYNPGGNVTIAQLVVMVMRAFNAEMVEYTNYSDSDWHSRWTFPAQSLGITYFVWFDQSLAPEDQFDAPANRYQMAAILRNTASCLGLRPSQQQMEDAARSIRDWQSVPELYHVAVASTYAMGLLQGDASGNFNGSANMTRAQAAVVLCRLEELINKGGPRLPDTPNQTDQPTPPSGSQPGTVPGTVSGDTTFALLPGEDAQAMMDRINAATPAYTPGYLANGKPITDENIKEILDEMKETMPDGTRWDSDFFYDYSSPIWGNGGGCNAFAYAVSDALFGEDAPMREHKNWDELKIGDVIWAKGGSYNHVSVIRTTPNEDGFYRSVSGNVVHYIEGGQVSWNGWGYLSSLEEMSVTIYSRY